jgi:mRNA interferase MazF
MIQGDIYWVSLKKPDKRRPVLILTRNSAIPELNSMVVASITTTVRKDLDSQVLLGVEDGMPQDCSISLDNIHTLPRANFGSYITHLPRERMVEVFESIKFAFGMEE